MKKTIFQKQIKFIILIDENLEKLIPLAPKELRSIQISFLILKTKTKQKIFKTKYENGFLG